MTINLVVQLKEALSFIAQRPCRCVPCDLCGGTGNVRVHDRSQPEEFDLELCPQCRDGTIETCERCAELEQLDEQLQEELWAEAERLCSGQ